MTEQSDWTARASRPDWWLWLCGFWRMQTTVENTDRSVLRLRWYRRRNGQVVLWGVSEEPLSSANEASP